MHGEYFIYMVANGRWHYLNADSSKAGHTVHDNIMNMCGTAGKERDNASQAHASVEWIYYLCNSVYSNEKEYLFI